MTTDPTIRERALAYFLQEAPELLQVLEQELLSLREGYSINKVHTLMRVTHTLKGAAASVGLESIKSVAHSLEDIFKTLCKPNVAIDPEIEALLFEGFECLRTPLLAEITGSHANNAEVYDQAAAIFTRLQEKLGDCFDQEAYIPTSTELGFDLTQSIFEVGVTQRLDEIANVIASGDAQAVASTLQAQAEVFLGLAESLNLPGFGAIATAAIIALTEHPDDSVTIAQVALEDFKQGQAVVLSGDRTEGGEPSVVLQQLTGDGEMGRGGDGEMGRWGDGEDDSPAPELEAEATDLLLEAVWSIPDLEDDLVEDEISMEPDGKLPFSSGEERNELEEVLQPERFLATSPYEPAPSPNANSDQRRTNDQTATPTQTPKKDSDPLSHTVRVNVEHLDRLNYFIGELLTNQNHHSLQDEQLQGGIQELISQLQQHQVLLSMLKDSSDKTGLVQSILENAAQLEAATEAIESVARKSSQILEKQQRLLTNARDDLLSARMVHLGDIFSRLPRVLQQLETLHSKPVALKLSGTEVLVDKALADKLYNPLLHLVRNAFDHGIEPMEVRQQRGKPEKGQIEIRAFHQGSNLMIQVQDDGQGLKFDQIRQRASDLNLVSQEQAGNLNEAQLMDLVFEPGFSTAEQVNNLSGRGIGLDVVRAQLQSLQGAVTVYSEPNRGTTFLLQIPFSMTMAKLCICQAGQTFYALLTDAVEQILVPQANQIRHWEGGKFLKWGKGADERMLPVFKLDQILNYCSPVTGGSREQGQRSSEVFFSPAPYCPLPAPSLEQVMRVLILRSQDKLLALEVDEIIGDSELVIRPLESIIMPPRYVYGGSILADGRLTLVIDGAELAKTVFDKYGNDASRGLAPRNRTNTALVDFTPNTLSNWQHPQLLDQIDPSLRAMSAETLLIVDDSLTLRQTLSLTLQQFGYQVLEARDGYEAIELLRLQPAIQLVLCDLEMPRMNGLEFLNYRRQDRLLAQIPVVILTSQSGEKHRLVALELGANAYMNKPYLEQELLATVADLLAQKELS